MNSPSGRVYVVDDDASGLAPELGLQSSALRQLVVGDVQATSSSVDTQSGRVAQSVVVRHNLADQSQVAVELHHPTTVHVEHQNTSTGVHRQPPGPVDPSTTCVSNQRS